MKNKTFTFWKVLLALSAIFFAPVAKACHFGAADMYVTYTGPNIDGCTGTTIYQYDVTVIIYYACTSCTTDGGSTPLTVNYQSQTAVNLGLSGATGTVTCDTVKGHADTLTSLCPLYYPQNSCRNLANASIYPAFQAREYKGTVILPYAQPDWVFSYSSCCRSISNLQGSSSNSFYIEAGLNNQLRYNNSTPRFLTNPLPYICVNQPATYLNGPFDPDGDPMTIVQQLPLQAAGSGINYAPGYSLADPIGSSASNPYTLNPTTGAATFTPLAVDVPRVLAFRADEIDPASGVRTAWAMRDVQFNILACAAPPPAIDSLKPTLTVSDGKVVPVFGGGDAIVTCPGNNLTFTINSSTGDKLHKLYMTANTAIVPGSTFTSVGDGTNSVTGTFSWTPGPSDIGEHTAIITSSDSTCEASQPIVLRNYTVIYIRVINGVDAGRDVLTCNLNPPKRQLAVKGYGNLVLNVKWSDVNGGPAIGIDNDTSVSPVVSGPGGTQYVVYSPDLTGQCKSRDTVLFINDSSNTIDIFPQADKFVMCRPGYLQLDAITTGGGPVDNTVCDTLPVFTCVKPDSITIWGSPVYGTDMEYDTSGTSSTIFPGDVLTSRYQFLITKKELREYGLRSGSIKSLALKMVGNTTNPIFEYANFTIYIKCTNSDKLSKLTGFESGMIPVYTSTANVTFPNGWNNFVFDKPYNWDTTKNLIIGICYSNNPAILAPCVTTTSGFPGVLAFMPTTYPATLQLKAPDPSTIDVCGANTLSGIEERSTRPIFGMTFCDVPGKPFAFTWYPGQLLSDSTIKAPLTYVPKTTTYQVSTLGKNGCRVADTMQVYIPVHNFSVWPADTSVCYGMTVPLEVRNGVYYQWFEYEEGKYLDAHNSLSCDYCANPVAKPLKSTHYKVMVGDDVFCYDTIDAYIEVRPLPQVNILTKDTIIRYGQSVQLLVNGAKLYNWTPVSSLNNPNISYPVATPTEPTTYVVSGISSTGCYSYDTVRVGINYRDNLQIPTAFTPNGDGKNDLFHVTNMTFQRFVEFRVFNRWGQQVYEGLDPKRGWDGTWKGVPQEMGDYNYIIRVGYPDGLVESYKGTVTLIR